MNDEMMKEINKKTIAIGQTMMQAVDNEDTEMVLVATVTILSFLICSVTKDMKKRINLIDVLTEQMKEAARLDDFVFGDNNKNEKAH